jgi:hypothetical protein
MVDISVFREKRKSLSFCMSTVFCVWVSGRLGIGLGSHEYFERGVDERGLLRLLTCRVCLHSFFFSFLVRCVGFWVGRIDTWAAGALVYSVNVNDCHTLTM